MRRITLPGWRVPILMYHRVTPRRAGAGGDYFFSISRRRFAQQMHYLQRLRFHVVTLEQIVDWLRRGRALPPRPVAITFDDGYADTTGWRCRFWSSASRHLFLVSRPRGRRLPDGRRVGCAGQT